MEKGDKGGGTGLVGELKTTKIKREIEEVVAALYMIIHLYYLSCFL